MYTHVFTYTLIYTHIHTYINIHTHIHITEIAIRDMQHEDEDEDMEDIDVLGTGLSVKKAKKKTSHLGLHINLFITFAYMSNQYIIAPTSAEYARLLGMPASMSGLIIAMSPFAALIRYRV